MENGNHHPNVPRQERKHGPNRRSARLLVVLAQVVDAPDSATFGRNVQERKTVENGEFAPIHDRPQLRCAMGHPVGDCHGSTTDECRPTGHETDHHQYATDQFDGSYCQIWCLTS